MWQGDLNLAYADQSISSDNFDVVQPPFNVEAEKYSHGGVADFARTLAYTAIQNPITGMSQIIDRTAGSNVANTLKLVERQDDAKFGSFDWHTQQVAAAAGTMVPFLACLAVTKNISRAVQAEEFALSLGLGSASATASAFRTGEVVSAGFAQAALLEPNHNQNRILQERLLQGITSGVTLGSMHVMSNKLSEFTGASAKNASILNKSLTTGAAGAGGGLVGLGVHSALTGAAMSPAEGVQSVYQAAFTGAVLGGFAGVQLRLHQPKSSLPNLEDYVGKKAGTELFDHEYFNWHEEKSTSWRALTRFDGSFKDLPKLSPLEKVEMIGLLARDADPLMSKPETMNAFVKKLEATQPDALENAQAAVDAAWARAHSLQEAMDVYEAEGPESKQNKRDFAGLKRLHKKAMVNVDETYDARSFALEHRRIDVEKAINEFLSDHHLPKIELLIDFNQDSQFNASYSNGSVTISPHFLSSRQLQPDLINTVYHELSHARQDVLHIILLADRLGLPQETNPAHNAAVKSEFERIRSQSFEVSNLESDPEQRYYGEPTLDRRIEERLNDFIDETLALRAERGLTADEKLLAQDMSRGIATYAEQLYVKNVSTTDRQLRNTQNAIVEFSDKSVNEIIDDLLTKPQVFKERFGFKRIPVELENLGREHKLNPLSRLERWRMRDASEEDLEAQNYYYQELLAKMRPAFVEQLSNLKKSELTLKQTRVKRYFASTLEQQAFPTGILAQITYESQR
jgi:hypothetical protein